MDLVKFIDGFSALIIFRILISTQVHNFPPLYISSSVCIILATLSLNCSGSSITTGSPQCTRGDLMALLRYKAGIMDATLGRLKSWNGTNYSHWQAVSCNNETAQVVGVFGTVNNAENHKHKKKKIKTCERHNRNTYFKFSQFYMLLEFLYCER